MKKYNNLFKVYKFFGPKNLFLGLKSDKIAYKCTRKISHKILCP